MLCVLGNTLRLEGNFNRVNFQYNTFKNHVLFCLLNLKVVKFCFWYTIWYIKFQHAFTYTGGLRCTRGRRCYFKKGWEDFWEMSIFFQNFKYFKGCFSERRIFSVWHEIPSTSTPRLSNDSLQSSLEVSSIFKPTTSLLWTEIFLL